MRTRAILMIVLAVVLASAPAFGAPEKAATAPAPKHPPTVKAETADPSIASGKVVETMDAGGYTYVCLEKDGRKTWVAVPQMKVAVGKEMAFVSGNVMTNFQSKTLNRTFDEIVFSSGPVQAGAAPKPVPGAPTGSKAQVSAKDNNIKVEKATGPNACTVSEVWAKRASLDKKQVVVKGQVVKVSPQIMNRNWIHIQDGTGDQKKGTHNLVVTSKEVPSVGDVVTVSGIVAKDKDFGAGYVYKVIVEDATVKK